MFFSLQFVGCFSFPARVWAVQMEDKRYVSFIGSAGRSSALKLHLFILFSILQLVFTISYVIFYIEFDILTFLGAGL